MHNAFLILAAVAAAIAWLGGSRLMRDPCSDKHFDPTKVLEQGLAFTSRSWEYGALVEAMLELEHPNLTVFGPQNGVRSSPVSAPLNSHVPALEIAKSVIWTNGSHQLIDGEGSPADPASLGVAALLLAANDSRYFAAAQRQAEYLLKNATRFHINSTSAAISHRHDPAELWGDFIYMVPPFLAAYGAVTEDISYFRESVLQCRLYHQVLATTIELRNGSTCHGLWRHIVSFPALLDRDICCSDPGVWLTSNAWAVAGITRVLATIQGWTPPVNGSISQELWRQFVAQSVQSLTEILSPMLDCVAAQEVDKKTGLAKNYLDGTNAESATWAFGDAAGTALMTSAIFRLQLMTDRVQRQHLDWAKARLKAVARHVNGDGVVSPVADVSHVPSERPVGHTSEGQSMVILMYAAWRDWQKC